MNTTRAFFAMAIAAIILALGCSGNSMSAHKVRTELARADLAHYIRVLSADDMAGRQAGTPGGVRAAEFITRQFQAYKLHPAFDGEFEQKFPFKAGLDVPPEKNNLTWTTAAGKAVRLNHLPLPFARPSSVQGELVFAGFCLRAPDGSWDDLKKISVKGKIALCLRHGPGGKANDKYTPYISFSYKYRKLRELGAKGVVFMSRAGVEPVRPGAFRFRNRGGPPAAFAEPGEFLKNIKGLAEVEKAMLEGKQAVSVKDAAVKRGDSLGRISLNTSYKIRENTGRNIGAYLRPPRKEQRIIVIGAHYDHIGHGHFASIRGRGHIHNGADDNASGTAVIMESAGVLRGELDGKKALPENVNVLFLALDAEERGLYGSRHFVASKYFRKRDTILMINLDMVGRLREDKGLHIQGADTADERLKALVARSFKKTPWPYKELKLKYVPGGSGPSDHASFYKKGTPVLFLHTGSHKKYHTSDDKFETINLDGVLGVTGMCLNLIRETAALKSPPVFRKAKGGRKLGRYRYRVRLGIMPAMYASDGKGVEVASVRGDSPVSKTGLREGDRIVELGGKTIGDIDDLMEFLSGANARSEYKLLYKRGDKKIESRTRLMPAK